MKIILIILFSIPLITYSQDEVDCMLPPDEIAGFSYKSLYVVPLDSDLLPVSVKNPKKISYKERLKIFNYVEYVGDKKGRIIGEIKYYYADRKQYGVTFSNLEERTGTVRSFGKKEGYWRPGANDTSCRKGTWTKLHRGGELMWERNYDDNGDWIDKEDIQYYDNGTIMFKGNLKNGKLNGKSFYYYESGELRAEVSYIDDLREGESFRYYKSGQLDIKTNYINDAMEGKRFLYYESGELRGEENYKKGIPDGDGTLIYYYKNGNISSIYNYKNGNEISSKEFKSNGKERFDMSNRTNEYLIKQYLDSTDSDIEGIYRVKKDGRTEQYKLAVIEIENDKSTGIILDARCVGCQYWTIGDTKASFEPMAMDGFYDVTWHFPDRQDKLDENYMTESESKGLLYRFNGFSMVKIYPKSDSERSHFGFGKNNEDKWLGNGSGIIFSKDGYISTNHHVIEEASALEVQFKYKNEIKTFNAKVVRSDPRLDLAIIKVDDPKFENLYSIPYNFAFRSSDVATEVYALGYPMIDWMGEDVKFTDGRISAKSGALGDVTRYQHTAPIQPGNSGGPLFDTKGNLIGINVSKIVDDAVSGVFYAVKTSYLIQLIDAIPQSIKIPESNSLAGKSITEQIKILTDYVVLIRVR